MDLPGVAGIFPPFLNPEHFEQLRPGRWSCTLCSFAIPLAFDTEKSALAHERTERHKIYAELAQTPWDGPAPGRSEDWKSDVGVVEELITPEQQKEIEYRQKVSRIPVTVQKWCDTFAPYVRSGEMLSVDEPTATPGMRRPRRSKPKVSKPEVPSKSEGSEDGSHAQRATGSTSSISDNERNRTQRRPAQPAPPAPSAPPTRPPQVCNVLIPNPVPKNVDPALPRTEVTPELRKWMNQVMIEMRFSPTKALQMRAFVQLPTDTKVSMIQTSVTQLRSMMIA